LLISLHQMLYSLIQITTLRMILNQPKN
jgi:hypothetical protein